MYLRSAHHQSLRRKPDAHPSPQQSSHRIDNPLHYIPDYINEAQKQLNARDTAIRDLKRELEQREKQHLAKKSALESQLLSVKLHFEAARQQAATMEQERAEQELHTHALDDSSGPADKPAQHAPSSDGMGRRCQELEAALHSLKEEKRGLSEQQQPKNDEWSAKLARLSHRCDALQSALKSVGYELDTSGELMRCARRCTRKRDIVEAEG